jgi:NADH:ubiquinone oxidoreductase subunit 3 (subunit A)
LARSGRGRVKPYFLFTFMPQNYIPIFIFMAVIGVLLPVTLLAAKLVRPDNPSKTKLMPYECGIDPIDDARGRYTVRCSMWKPFFYSPGQ